MKTAILKLLKEADDYISGQELCEYFHVSRTAIWKVINQLKAEGYEIEAVRNRGYKLHSVSDVLSRQELESSMETEWAGCRVCYYDSVDSTNTKVKQLAEEGMPHGTLAVAETQTMGKGRRGRGWVSNPNEGIWMSLLLKPAINPAEASMLTLVAALAVADGVKETTGLEAQIKWPNDLVLGGKKICGILTEMSTELDYIHYVVVGIGINANIEEFPQEIRAVATSLFLEGGQRVMRSRLICSVMKAFERFYKVFMDGRDLSQLVEAYNVKLVNLGKSVRVMAPSHEYNGTALGIDSQGQLLVKKEDGSVCQVLSGEVSVRGIYGYV